MLESSRIDLNYIGIFRSIIVNYKTYVEFKDDFRRIWMRVRSGCGCFEILRKIWMSATATWFNYSQPFFIESRSIDQDLWIHLQRRNVKINQ